MHAIFRKILIIFAVLFLFACGGGGGGSSNGGGSSSPTLQLYQSSVSFYGSIDQTYPSTSTIAGTILNPRDEPYYLYVELESDQLIQDAWFSIDGASGTIYIEPRDPDSMEPGSYQETIQVMACRDASCTRQINGSPQTITVTYQVDYDPDVADRDNDGIVDSDDPFPLIANQAPVLNLAAQYPGDTGRMFELDGSALATDLDGSIVSWQWEQLYGEPMLVSPVQTAMLSFTLPSGQFDEWNTFRLTVTDDQGASSYADFTIEFVHPIEYEVPNSFVGGYVAADVSTSLDIEISANALSEWQLSSDSSAITFSDTQNFGSATVTVNVDFTDLSVGTNDLLVYLTDLRQQLTHEIPVSAILRHDRPVVEKNGVALSQTADTSRLSAELTLLSEAGNESLVWNAVSNQSWLTLSASSGVAGAQLTVTADPSTLSNGFYSAEVTLTSENSAIAETVSVGLFLSDESYAAQTDSTTSSVMLDIVADPTRPWVYGVDGDSGIYIYDLYSAQELGSYSIGGNLNSIAISNDGQSIFVFDSLGKRVFVVNTDTFTINNELSLASVIGNNGQGLAFLRPRGLDLILVGGSTLINVNSGEILNEDYLYLSTSYVADNQSTVLQSFGGGSNYYSIYLVKVNANPVFSNAEITSEYAFEVDGGYGFPVDFASTRDLSKIWISTGAQVRTYSYDGESEFQLLSNLDTWQGWQNALESGPNYEYYYLGQDYDDVDNVCAFDTALDIEQNCINPPSRDVAIRMLKLSSDGFRGVVFSDPDYYNENVQPVTFFNALH